MEEKRRNKGITLIALIITIIVMLILVTVSINIAINNGLFTQAGKAAKETRKAAEKEQRGEMTIGGITGNVADLVNMYTGNEEYVTWKAEVKSEEPTEKDDTKKEIHISTPEELKWLQEQVNAEGNTYEGYTIYLENNLDLGAKAGTGSSEAEKWETEANEEFKWTSIGKTTTNQLNATFDGNGHVIKGVYVNDTSNFNGVFGRAKTVKNLIIKDSYIKAGSCTGGIAGRIAEDIENCHNMNTTVELIEGEYYTVGGIAGQIGNIAKNCTNTGTIVGNGKTASGNTDAGGIAGQASNSSTIQECSNSGAVTGAGQRVGGIAGYANTSTTIQDCSNSGAVTGAGKYVGGIVGLANTSTTIQDCSNSGAVTGAGNGVGGIVGFANTSATIQDCSNSGTMTGAGVVGGIIGYAGSVVTRCYNIGTVTGKSAIGGIVGSCVVGIGQQISYCYNIGTVTGKGIVGGISGYLGDQGAEPTALETLCYNKGKIVYTGTGTTYGGVIGEMAADSNVVKCYYLSSIEVPSGVGAIEEGGDLELQNSGVTAVEDDIKTYEEFLEWIKQFE